jgi:hypothetical protein
VAKQHQEETPVTQQSGPTVQLTAETHQRLEAIGQQTGISITDIIGKLPQIIEAFIPVIQILLGGSTPKN